MAIVRAIDPGSKDYVRRLTHLGFTPAQAMMLAEDPYTPDNLRRANFSPRQARAIIRYNAGTITTLAELIREGGFTRRQAQYAFIG